MNNKTIISKLKLNLNLKFCCIVRVKMTFAVRSDSESFSQSHEKQNLTAYINRPGVLRLKNCHPMFAQAHVCVRLDLHVCFCGCFLVK